MWGKDIAAWGRQVRVFCLYASNHQVTHDIEVRCTIQILSVQAICRDILCYSAFHYSVLNSVRTLTAGTPNRLVTEGNKEFLLKVRAPMPGLQLCVPHPSGSFQ